LAWPGMIPAFDVDLYLIPQTFNAIDMCLANLLVEIQNVLERSMSAECFRSSILAMHQEP
jgi:hypothetical protein